MSEKKPRTEELTESDILKYLDALDVASEVESDEFTAADVARRRGIRTDKARKMLFAEVEAGRLTCRKAVAAGKSVVAFRLVKKK